MLYKKLLRNCTAICQWCIELCMNSRDKCEDLQQWELHSLYTSWWKQVGKNNKFNAKKKRKKEGKCPILVRFWCYKLQEKAPSSKPAISKLSGGKYYKDLLQQIAFFLSSSGDINAIPSAWSWKWNRKEGNRGLSMIWVSHDSNRKLIDI